MKKKMNEILKLSINFFKYNRQFFVYVLISLILTTGIRVYTMGGVFSPQPLLIDLSLILILGSFAYLYTPQKQFRYLFLLVLIFTTMAISNAVYFSFFNSFASISMLVAIGQVGDVSDAVFDGLSITQFLYILGPILFYIIYRRLKNRDYFNYIAKFEKSRRLFLIILSLGFFLAFVMGMTLSSRSWSRLHRQWNREYIVTRFGMVAYQLNDIASSLRPVLVSWVGQDVAIRNFNEHFENNPPIISNNEYSDIFVGKNIIFVHMESTAGFLVDLEINNREVTPHLNRLAKEGIYFTNFFPQIGVGTSSDAEFTLLASLMPSTRGTVFVSYFDRTFRTIPWILRDMGYYTFSMHGNRGSMWNRAVAHPRLGYIDFYSSTSFDIDEVIGLGISDKSFFRQAIPILENIERNNENYMGKIITLTHHTPFATYAQFADFELTYTNAYGQTFDFIEGTTMGSYIISAHYADEALGLFIELIEASEYFNNTVFVFYGDHDPRLALREYYHLFNFNPLTGELKTAEDEDYIVFDNIAREINRKTPLIIWTPNQEFNRVYNYPIGSIDISPTIGNMMGFKNEFALGNDIFEIRNYNMVIFPNGNFITSRVFFHNTREVYRVFSQDELLEADYITERRAWSEHMLQLSNNIIVHDLIRRELEARNLLEETS